MFRDWEKMEEEKERSKIISNIEICARERWYLLKLKAKFAGTCMCTCTYACIILMLYL